MFHRSFPYVTIDDILQTLHAFEGGIDLLRCLHSLRAKTLCSEVFWDPYCLKPWCVTWRTTKPSDFQRFSWENLTRLRPFGAVR